MSINRAIAVMIANLKATLCYRYAPYSIAIESLGPPYTIRHGQRKQLAQEIHGYVDVMLERRLTSFLEVRNSEVCPPGMSSAKPKGCGSPFE